MADMFSYLRNKIYLDFIFKHFILCIYGFLCIYIVFVIMHTLYACTCELYVTLYMLGIKMLTKLKNFVPYYRNRVDYIRHPVEKPYERPLLEYVKPRGEHDLLTSYCRDFPSTSTLVSHFDILCMLHTSIFCSFMQEF